MKKFLNIGWINSLNFKKKKKKDAYSWWSYRFNARANNKGWRIDYCMVSENIKTKIKGAEILNDVVHSDHCPISLLIER